MAIKEKKYDFGHLYALENARTQVKENIEEQTPIIYNIKFQPENDYNIVLDNEDWSYFINSIEKAEPNKKIEELLNTTLRFKKQ